MDWLTFISKSLEVLAWPIVTLTIFMLLRQKLFDLIPVLKRLKYKDLEAEFGEGVREVSEKLPIVEQPTESPAGDKAAGERSQLLYLAEVAPRAAILEAWLRVEHAAQRLVERAGIADRSLKMVGPTIIRTYLERTGLLSSEQLESFNKLRSLRNKVVHYAEVLLPLDEVIEYVDLSLSLAAQFDALRANS